MPGVGTTHHIQLGGHYYLVRPGSYLKKVAPTFGARFTSGDPDFNNLSMWQHWAQKCFVGGIGQDLFSDDAMYDEGVGVDTSRHEIVRLSRDLNPGAGANWTVSKGTANASGGFKAVIYNSTLYVATISSLSVISHLWKYDPATDGWVRITSLDGQSLVIRSVGTFDGKLFLGGRTVAGVPKVVFASGALASWTALVNPGGVNVAVYAMRAFQRKLYVAYGTQIWRLTESLGWDGNTVFYKADQNSDSNYIQAFETHLGFLYFVSQNGHIHRTDGNSTFDLWSWDGGTQGVAIKSFDGRLFVLTFEYSDTVADGGEGVLYQMSGSAVTQLKRFGVFGVATRIGGMVVYDRKLFYGASNLLALGPVKGFGVACYDPVEDAHSLFATNRDTVTYAPGAAPYSDLIVDDQIFFSGKLFVFVRGHGAFKTIVSHVDVSTGAARYDLTGNGGGVGSENGGWLSTSTYDAGTAGVKKLWRKVTLDAAIPAPLNDTTIFWEYSIDNGLTWTTGGTVSAVSNRADYSFWLNNVIATSIKLRFTFRSIVPAKTPVLYGFVVSYLPVPEPNWMWQFTIVLSERQQLMDGTTATVDTEAELAYLKTMYRTKQLVTFQDAEGDSWASVGGFPGVLIQDMSVALRDLTQPLEGEVNVTLLEAVETY